ncbi:MAG: serine hydrolase [Caldilineaceae bacterium]|nr:serine hydrolase [Caldilineaceae bacterium]
MALQGLQEQIEDAIRAANAHMGVAMRHLESGDEINIHATESFPMASVLKIPVLVEALRQVDAGRFTLDDRWELTTAEKNLGSGVLTFFDDGLLPTVRDLLTLMIIISDNTATDMVIHRLGIGSITETMRALGLQDIHLPLTIRQIFESILPSADPTQDPYALELSVKDFTPPANAAGYSKGPDNNVSTPRDMTELLDLIFRGRAASREGCDEMLRILLKQTLNDRLPRFLPTGTRVAHKTGTLGGFRNDAGILYVSDNQHVAVTVFSEWDYKAVEDDPIAERQRIFEIDSAFGHITRAIYDAYAGAAQG